MDVRVLGVSSSKLRGGTEVGLWDDFVLEEAPHISFDDFGSSAISAEKNEILISGAILFIAENVSATLR